MRALDAKLDAFAAMLKRQPVAGGDICHHPRFAEVGVRALLARNSNGVWKLGWMSAIDSNRQAISRCRCAHRDDEVSHVN